MSIAAAVNGRPVGPLRVLALVALALGASGSLALMLRAGNPPLFLLVMFIGWVLSPFVGLLLADLAWKRWRVVPRATLHVVMLIVALGSLACYGGIVPMPPDSRPAFLFLMVPLGSWMLLAIALLIGARASRRISGLRG